jgi:hypothetical protein
MQAMSIDACEIQQTPHEPVSTKLLTITFFVMQYYPVTLRSLLSSFQDDKNRLRAVFELIRKDNQLLVQGPANLRPDEHWFAAFESDHCKLVALDMILNDQTTPAVQPAHHSLRADTLICLFENLDSDVSRIDALQLVTKRLRVQLQGRLASGLHVWDCLRTDRARLEAIELAG